MKTKNFNYSYCMVWYGNDSFFLRVFCLICLDTTQLLAGYIYLLSYCFFS